MAMANRPDVSLIEAILSPWSGVIGGDYPGYRNHVVRMLTFCLALRACSEEERRKLEIAACFHDIGLWTANTFDYLEPSVPPAREYLREHGLEAWGDEIAAMILDHHKLTAVAVAPSPLVELFRRGDLVDFSLGLVRFGLDANFVRQVKRDIPNAGFHRALVRMTLHWVSRHPLNPAPMMKW